MRAKTRAFRLGQAERVVRPERADFQRRDRQLEIIDRDGRRREMKNEIEFFLRQENEIGNVMLHEAIILVPRQVLDVGEIAGHEIIDRDDACDLP